LLVAFALSHHVTITLFSPCVTISAFIESVSLVLLRLILSPKVVPPSFEALKITSPFEFGVPLSVNHTTYTLSPDVTIGAFRSVWL
jgi:hypothetical protein